MNATSDASMIGSIVTLLIGAQLMSYVFVYFVLSRVLDGKTVLQGLGFRKREPPEEP